LHRGLSALLHPRGFPRLSVRALWGGVQDFWDRSFLQFIARRFGEDRCFQVAASLTFTSLLALVPLLTITVTVVSAFPVFSEFTDQIKTFIIENLTPDSVESVKNAITFYTQQFFANATKLQALGIIFLVITAAMLMLTIDGAFNQIWRVAKPRPLLNRLLSYWAMLTVGPVLIGASLSLTSYLVGLTAGLTSQLPTGVILLKLVPVVLTTFAFTLLYVSIPNLPVSWRHALVGGVVAALAFEFMKRGFGFYIAHFPTYELLYGAFASLLIFLLWLYLSWLVVLVGAVITASLPFWGSAAWKQRQTVGQQFYDAISVLEMLCDAFETGKLLCFSEMLQQSTIGPERLEEALEKLVRVNLVSLTADDGWVLIRNPDTIKVGDVYRLFVFDPAVSGRQPKKPIDRLIGLLGGCISAELDVSLKTLCQETKNYKPSGA
jgi:membrane protein